MNKEITDADIEELENMLSFKKVPSTNRDTCIFKAAQDILQNSISIISMLSLESTIKLDAANYLVEDCLLIFKENLFKDEDFMDTEGFVKYVPEDLNLAFCGRLAHYNITLESYLNSIIIPDIWRTRLSADGIMFLCTMTFYRKLLNLSCYASSNEAPFQVVDHDNNKEKKENSLITFTQFSSQQSSNC
ncbi:unnamed protein product [Rotaria sp. Silwood2]|nr:unnamed protein product [Rotaria sp. Silwood2]CAF2864186.1 unnamed protein product [Rotaria sp. Silwood2]CAF3096313.1 unnamed protein product [Rotaria sp. Silwood2]CAF3226324.1 unnamed protein product [Rotaria sp. Silwood2]CAF4061929.1 unnamed protein product [Rotaria sp. Silwood2]